MANLEQLALDNTQVSDVGLAHLQGLTTLQHLQLTGTKVTKDGVAALRPALPKCRIISYQGMK